MSNKKLSSFESISTSEINDSSVYVSAVQKLDDGSYKNINIPISQLSGLWNNDVQLAIANADFEGGAIDAEVIHQAALLAVEAALTEARQAVNAAIAAANDFAGDVATGNTATLKAIADAQLQLNQAIQDGQSVVALMQTMYAQYFGDNGEVRQALNEANRDLNTSRALLTSAQEDLQALANGEITPESLHEIERTVNGIKEMWGIEGTYVNSEGTVANKVLEYVDMALAQKNLKMTNINGETNNVTSFEQLVDAANGMYTTTLNRMNTAEQKVTQMQEEWDVTKGEMSEYVKTSDFSDPTKASLKSAVKSMTDSLIKQTVRDTTLDVITTITIPINSPQGYTVRVPNIEKETFYYMSWDDAEGDNAIPLNYQFKVVASGSAVPSADNNSWSPLTLDGVNSPTVVAYDNENVIPDTNDRYLFIQYNGLGPATKQIDVKVCIEKYLSQTQILQTANAIVLSAINSLKEGGQLASSLTLTDNQISTAVGRYFNSIEFDATSIKQTSDLIQQTVLSFLDEGNNNYRTLQSVIKSAKDSIEQSVEDYTLTLLEEFKNSAPNTDHKINIDYSIDNSGSSITFKNRRRIISNLEQGHTYFIKCVALSKIYYKYGTYNFANVNVDVAFLENENNGWTKVVTPDSIKIDVPSDASWSTITFFIESAKNNANPPQYLANGDFSVQVFETATSKAANFKITPEMIKETISGDTGADGIIHLIYQRLARPSGTSTTWGEVGGGFLNQAQVDESAEEICRTLMGMSTGDASTDPIVRSSELRQSLDEIKSDVSKVQYLAVKNEGTDTISSEYFGISNRTVYSGLNSVSQYLKGPEFDITPNASDAIGYFKVKVPYPNTDYTLLLVGLDKYNFGEVHFVNSETLSNITENNFKQDKSHTSCIYTPDTNYPTKNELNPLHFGNVTTGYLSFKIIRAAGNNNTLNATYFLNNPVYVKLGIPTDVAVSNIKQTADSITEQVSSLEETWGPNGKKAQSLNTALLSITPSAIESVVAEEIDGKLTGYSTIEQTKDYIASTVGGTLVTNKFHDPLFKNGFGYWIRYPDAEMATIDSPYTNVYRKFIPSLSTYYQITNQYYDWKIESNPSIVFYDNLNTLGSGSQIKNCGVYTRVKLQPKQKYTASFYIKLSKKHTALKMNLGLTAELAMNAKTFCIAPWDVTKDASYSPKLVKKTNVADWNNHASDEIVYYEFNNSGSAGYISNSNKWCLSDITKPNDSKFGLWIDFYSGGVRNLIDEIFDDTNSNSNSTTVAPGPQTFETDFRWFKIWFTFTADEKYYKKGDSFANNSLFGLTKLDETFDRAFCFEIASRGVVQNAYAQFYCEIAYPMLNVGSTPLKFSSQEATSESYSTISQTNKSIELSVNNAIDKLTGELNNAGIKLDGKNSRIEFNARTSAFTGAVNAESFKVTPKNSNSSIELIIYNSLKPEHAILRDKGFDNGVPLLIARCGTDVYVINLTKLTGNTDGSYWKIDTDHPITEKILYTGNSSYDYIVGPSNEITFYQFTDNSVNIYSHKFICESEIELKIVGTIVYSGISSNKYFTTFNYNTSPQSVTVPLKNNKTKTITFTDKGCNPNLSDVINDEPIVSTKAFTYNLPSVSYGSYNTPIIELGNYTGNPLYRISAYNPYFQIDGKTKCGITNIGTYRKCRVYKRMDNGVLIDFPEKRYCFIVEKNNTKKFIGFCGYNEIQRRYNAYIDSQNPYSGSYGYQSDRQRELGEYFVKDGLYEVSLDNRVSQDGYNALDACSISNCKILFTEYEINNFEEVLNRGVSAALANDYFRIVS